MKKIKILSTLLTFILTLTFVLPSVQVFAKSYSDVPSTHWAYKQIDYVTDAGYMSGNTEGAFAVNQRVDPFEMSKILARVAGFQTGANASSTKLSEQETIYEKHKAFISQYSSFTLWNTSANREIAYLLEKGILADSDLNKFVIKTVENTERIVNPTREDLCYYLVKALGKESEASALTNYTKFADDSSISSTKKASTYYLRSKGVLSGDANNNFNPKNNITKAEMATILYNVDTKINGVTVSDNTSTTGTTGNTNTGSTNNTNTGSTTTSQLTVVTGTIKEINNNFKTFGITLADGTQKNYVLKSTGTVYLDNVITTINSLTVGMPVSCVIENNSSIVTLRATTPSTDSTGTTNNTNTGTNTGSTNNSNTGTTTTVTVPSDALKVTGLIVSHNTGFDASSRTITIGTPTNTVGATTTTNNVTYNVHQNASITLDGNKVLLGQLNPYDAVTLYVSNNMVYSIEAKTRFSSVSGVLVEKKFESIDSYILSVQDRTTKAITDYKITSTTKYVRDGETSTFDEIRIGDSITLYLDYDKIITANATMTSKSTVKGIIKAMTIGEYSGTVTIESTTDTLTQTTTRNTYTIKPNDYDIYNLRVGYQVTLTLESSEVTAVKINETVAKAPVTGIIESVGSGTLVLKTTYGFMDVNTDFASTLVVNSKTGVTGSTRDLSSGLNVTVYWNDNSTTATTIMIN